MGSPFSDPNPSVFYECQVGVPKNPGTRNLLWVLRSSEIRETVVACYDMKDKLHPDTSVSTNAQKQFFRPVPSSPENETLAPLVFSSLILGILCAHKGKKVDPGSSNPNGS